MGRLLPLDGLDVKVLSDILMDLDTARAVNGAAYTALEDKAIAGRVPDIKEQDTIMRLISAANEYMDRAMSAISCYI